MVCLGRTLISLHYIITITMVLFNTYKIKHTSCIDPSATEWRRRRQPKNRRCATELVEINKHIGRHNHVYVLIHFLPIFDRACTKGWHCSYATTAAGNYWRRSQPDLSRRASRIWLQPAELMTAARLRCLILRYILWIYEGRSKSFEPNLCTEEIDWWAYIYFSALSPPLSMHNL